MSAQRAILWSFGSQYTSFIIAFVLSVILARILGPHEIGIYSVAVGFTFILQNLQGFAINQFIIREPDLRHSHMQTAFAISLVLTLSASAMLLFGAGAAAAFYREPELRSVLIVLACSNALTAIGLPAQALLMRELRYRALFIANTVPALIGGAVTIYLALHGAGAMAQAWYVLIQMVLKSALVLVFKPDQIFLRPSFREWRTMTRFGSRMMIVSFTNTLFGRAPDMIIGRLSTMSAVGYYSRANGISDQAYALLFDGGAGALFSAFAKRRNEGGDLVEPYLKGAAYVIAIIWMAFTSLGLLAEPVIHFLYGPAWGQAAGVLQWLCVAQLLICVAIMHYNLPVIFDRTDLLIASEVGHMTLGLTAFALCTWWGGVEGAAIGRVIHAAIFSAINFYVIHKLLKFSRRRFAMILLRCAIATAIGAIPALAARLLWAGDKALMPIALLIGASLLTAPFWFVGLRIAGHPFYGEVTGQIRRRFGR